MRKVHQTFDDSIFAPRLEATVETAYGHCVRNQVQPNTYYSLHD